MSDTEPTPEPTEAPVAPESTPEAPETAPALVGEQGPEVVQVAPSAALYTPAEIVAMETARVPYVEPARVGFVFMVAPENLGGAVCEVPVPAIGLHIVRGFTLADAPAPSTEDPEATASSEQE